MDKLFWERSLVTVVLVLFATIRFPKVVAVNGKIPALFAFGDSILDTGNNNNILSSTKCNYPPYGRDFPGAVPTGRCCNGKTPTDLIAMALGIKDSVPAYLSGNLSPQDLATGVCFASAGSGIDDQTARLLATISQPAQLQMFREYIGKLTAAVGQQQATQIISDGVFLVSAGNNDIAITFTSLALAVPFPIYSAGLVSTASNFFKSIYALGARKVWVLSTLPLGCLPGGRLVAGGPLRACAVFENMLAQSFNGQLSTAVNSIRASYSDYDIRFIDVYTPLYNIIQNPQASGFEDVADACCGTGPFKTAGLCNLLVVCPNPSTYVFWDFAHPTERAYRLVVDSILQSNSMNINASTLSN